MEKTRNHNKKTGVTQMEKTIERARVRREDLIEAQETLMEFLGEAVKDKNRAAKTAFAIAIAAIKEKLQGGYHA